MSNDVLKVDREGPLLVLTIDDPKTRNGLSPTLTRELVEALNAANADLTVSCVILTGAGEVFCAGGNIKDMYARSGVFAGSAAEIRQNYQRGVQTIAKAFYEMEVPTIAAVNGAAMGAGLDFALMCNIRLAADTAKFAESFIKLGLTSAAGGAWHLTRAVGASMAAELTLTGDTVDARRALELGIVSHVVAPHQLMAEARALAGRITRHPPHSIRLNTRNLREAARLDLPAALEIASGMQAIVQHTEDQYEAVASVMEKRAPAYKGR